MRILVTGGASFIGGHIIEKLVSAGHNITTTVLHKKIKSRGGIKVKTVNLTHSNALESIRSIDLIIHCAASLPLDGVSVNDFIKNNIVATMNLFNFAKKRKIKRVIMCSSMAIYGNINVKIVDHTTPSRSPGPYGQSKLSAEQIASTFEKNVSCIALRLPGVLGKGAHDAFLPYTLQRIKNNLPVKISNPDSPFNNLAHVEDVVRFIYYLTSSDWDGFHAIPIASSNYISVRRVIEIMAEAISQKVDLKIAPSNDQPFCINDSKARSMGYQSQDTEEIIRRFAIEAA